MPALDSLVQVSEQRFVFHIETLDKPTTFKLQLKNVSGEPIGFKVKTTRPRRYCVKPNASSVDAGAEIELQLQLQPLRRAASEACESLSRQAEAAAPDADLASVLTHDNLKEELGKDLRDKFLLQAVRLKEREFETSLFDSVDKEELYEQKFRCDFLFAQGLLEELVASRVQAESAAAAAARNGGDNDDGEVEYAASGAAAGGDADADAMLRLRRELAEREAEVARLTAQTHQQKAAGPSEGALSQSGAGGARMAILALQALLLVLVSVLVGKYVL